MRSFTKMVRTGTLLAVLTALSLAACATSRSTEGCERAKYWYDEHTMHDDYNRAVLDAFNYDVDWGAQRGLVAYARLRYLERYCWQTRLDR